MSAIRAHPSPTSPATSRWTLRLVQGLLPDEQRIPPGKSDRQDEVDAFASDVAGQDVTVLTTHLLHGDLSLWAATLGDGDRAARLRTIELDLLRRVHQEVESARELVVATRPPRGPDARPDPARRPRSCT